MERLTARRPDNGLAYLIKVKSNEQAVDSQYPNTLKSILECFGRLADYEDALRLPDGSVAAPEDIGNMLGKYLLTGLTPEQAGRYRWIPAESETPEIGQAVLLYLPDKEDDKIRAGEYLGEGDYRILKKVYRGYEINAWMLLPEPPKAAEAEKERKEP